MSSLLWDSSSNFEDSSSSRWDHDETPAFPLPFSSMVSPRLPKRQQSMERQEMIDMMVLSDAVDGISRRVPETSMPGEADQASASTTPPGLNDDDIDRPRQHVIPRRPQRQMSPMGGMISSCGSNKAGLAKVRFQCLINAQQGSARRLGRDSGNHRAPKRSGGFIDIKRTSTL